MKKSLIALAALATVATAAQAQSSVTVYGVMDTGIARSTGLAAGSVTYMQNGGLSTSRFGFRGVEDLGGGLKAKFNLEGGLLDSNGASDATPLFARAAVVGLEGAFGEIKLGRQNTIAYDTTVKFDAMGAGNIGGLITTVDGTAAASGSGNVFNAFGASRWDNAVQYYTPKINGISANAQYRAGGVVGNASAGKGIAGGLHYDDGKFAASAVYLAQYAAAATGFAAGDKQLQYYSVYASYDFGVAKVLGGHSETKGEGATGSAYKVDYIGAIVPITAPLSARLSYAKIDNNQTGKKPDQYAAGLHYAMSKRTTLYTVVAFASQDGNSALNTVDSGKNAPGYGVVAGNDSKTYAVGVRHTF